MILIINNSNIINISNYLINILMLLIYLIIYIIFFYSFILFFCKFKKKKFFLIFKLIFKFKNFQYFKRL